MSEINIETRLNQVRARIDQACLNSDRNPAEVKLLAVSKTKPLEMIKAAIACGQSEFGENYLQDAITKIPEIPKSEAIWHYIGGIQSNKTKLIVSHFDWVHTVCSEKIALRLNNQRQTKPINILIQINIDEEENKAGVSPTEAADLIEKTRGLEMLKLRGLMAIPAINQEKTDNAFEHLCALKDKLKTQFELSDFDQLSMGMSADLELAIAAGSTIVRVGTDIFGSRN